MSNEENKAVQANDSRKELKEFKDEFSGRLNEVQGKDAKKCVFNYYGERGGGKSSFVGDLRREARKEGYTVLELDFSSERLEPEDALERLMRDLEKKINFKECGEGMRKLGRNWDVKLSLRRRTAAFILLSFFAAVFGILEYGKSSNLWFNIFSVIIGAFGFAFLQSKIQEWSLKGAQKEIQSTLKDENKDLDFEEKEDLRELLPEWFAKDMNKWHEGRERRNVWLNKGIEWHNKRFAKDANERCVNREHRNEWYNKWIERLNKWFEEWPQFHDETLCIFIDAYDSRKNDDRWLYGEHGLCRHLDHAIFAITGEEKLPWENGDENRDKFWKEEPHGTLVCREIKKPGKDESEALLKHKYESVVCRELKKLGEEEGRALLKHKYEPLWKTLYEHTDGWPELLDKWCKAFVSEDESNDLSEVSAEQREKQAQLSAEQGEKLAEWVKAFVEDHWHVKVSESVYLMAGMRRWTRDLLECAMWASGAGINDDIEDVMKELGAEGLITRESADVYSMCNDSIRSILARNTILEKPQRRDACEALLKTHTAIGAEAAYYLGYEDKKVWTEDLAARLELRAEDLGRENDANKKAQSQEEAKEKLRLEKIYRHREEVIKSIREKSRKEWEEQQHAVFERIDSLYEMAVNVHTLALGANGGYDNLTVIAMNKRAENCNDFGEHRKAYERAKEALELCEKIPKEKKNGPTEKTRKCVKMTLCNACTVKAIQKDEKKNIGSCSIVPPKGMELPKDALSKEGTICVSFSLDRAETPENKQISDAIDACKAQKNEQRSDPIDACFASKEGKFALEAEKISVQIKYEDDKREDGEKMEIDFFDLVEGRYKAILRENYYKTDSDAMKQRNKPRKQGESPNNSIAGTQKAAAKPS